MSHLTRTTRSAVLGTTLAMAYEPTKVLAPLGRATMVPNLLKS